MWTVMVIGKATGRNSLCRSYDRREDAEAMFLDLKARTVGVMRFELDAVGGVIEGRGTTAHLAWTDTPIGGVA